MGFLLSRLVSSALLSSLVALVVGVTLSVSSPALATVTPCNLNFNSLLIPITGQLFNVVIDNNCQYAYVTNKSKNQIEVISLTDRTLGNPIAVGSAPIGLDLSPDGTKLYVANSGEPSISIIDVAQHAEVRKVSFNPYPFESDTPLSLAAAQNGLVIFSTRQYIFQMDSNADYAITKRTDFGDSLGQTAQYTFLRASQDRSVIGIVGSAQSLPFYKYSSTSNTFTNKKELVPSYPYYSYGSITLSENGSTSLAWGKYVIDENNNLIGTVPSTYQANGAVIDSSGKIAYRSISDGQSKIEAIDLSAFFVIGSFNIPDTTAEAGSQYLSFLNSNASGTMKLSDDGKIMALITDNGLSLINIYSVITPPTPTPTPMASPTPATTPNTNSFNMTSPLINSGLGQGRRVATDGDGLFLNIYEVPGYGSVFGQYFKNGSATTWPFTITNTINPLTTEHQISVAMNSSGNAVATWWNGATATAQLIPSNTTSLAFNPITVGTGSGGDTSLQVAMDSSGDFAVVWANNLNAYLKLFSQDGSPITQTLISDACEASAFEISLGCNVSVSMNDNEVIVSWTQQNHIYVRRYTHALSGINTVMADRTPADQPGTVTYNTVWPQIALDSTGNAAVTWMRAKNKNGKLPALGIYAQWFNASNSPSSKTSSGEPFDYAVVSDSKFAGVPDISINNQNKFAIAWENNLLKKSKVCNSAICYQGYTTIASIKAQTFTATDLKISKGKVVTVEKGVFSNDKNLDILLWKPNAESPAVAIDEQGAFQVQWSSNMKQQLFFPEQQIIDQYTAKTKYYIE